MTNTTYTDFPFSAKGINFISRIYNNSPFLEKINAMPKGTFEQINVGAVTDLMDLETYTLGEIQIELDRINDGGSHAFILLGENN